MGPGGKFWSLQGWRVSFMILDGLSELGLSVLLLGDSLLRGRIGLASDS